MNTKCRILMLLLLLLSFSIKGQDVVDTPYEFPVRPGMEQWKSFKTGQEMKDACQIPIDILNRLSTKALAETCLNYPLYFEYTAFNSERMGIGHIIENFNGLTELSKRENGVQELVKLYEGLPVNTKTKRVSSKIKENASILHLSYLELLLSDEAFFQKLSVNDCTELKKVVTDKYEKKLAEKDVYSLYSVEKTLLLGAKILEKSERGKISATKRENVVKFIHEFERSNIDLMQEISKYIYE